MKRPTILTDEKYKKSKMGSSKFAEVRLACSKHEEIFNKI